MNKTTQIYKAEYLGIAQSYMNQIFTGKKKVSWPLAHNLSKLFPEKNIEWWRYASPMQLEWFLDNAIPKPEKNFIKKNKCSSKRKQKQGFKEDRNEPQTELHTC